MSKQFSSIWSIDTVLSGAATPGQSGPGSDGKEGVLHIPQSSSSTGTSLSDCLVSYQDTRWEESYPSAELNGKGGGGEGGGGRDIRTRYVYIEWLRVSEIGIW